MDRDELIHSLSRNLGRTAPPPDTPPLSYRHSVHQQRMQGWDAQQIMRAFIEYSRTIGVRVVETIKSELNASMAAAVRSLDAHSILMSDDFLLKEMETAKVLSSSHQLTVWSAETPHDEMIRLASQADVGISVARLALAESATVLLGSEAGAGRSVTLLPESAIYIVPAGVILPSLTQAMAWLKQCYPHRLPAAITMVSGPSATSDIELVRVVGVHGPIQIVHMVVTDMVEMVGCEREFSAFEKGSSRS